MKITADGFDLGDKRNPIEANDLPEAERVVKAWLGRAKGPTPYQHGATPHERGPKTSQGPTARPIAAAMLPADGSGLQPSEMFLNDAPGALPQAGMGSAVGAGVVWKRVEKKALLEHHSCSLQSEAFLDDAPERSIEHEMVRLGDVCRLYQPKTITAQDLVADGPYIVFGANGVIGRYTEFNHEQPEVVVTCRGATCGTVNMTSEKCWITGNAMVVSPLDERIEKRFLFYLLQASDLSSTISGSAQPQITRQSLSPYEIPLPPLEEQRRIVAEIEGYQNEIARLESEIAANRERIQTTIDAVWSGDSESANGAPPSQPGATPQVSNRKPTKG